MYVHVLKDLISETLRGNLEAQIADESDEVSPKKVKLQNRLNRSKCILNKKVLNFKNLREKHRRQNKKICTIEILLKDLIAKCLLLEEDAEVLRIFNVTTKELLQRRMKHKNVIIKPKYSSDLKSFALSLNYYSPIGYNYAKQKYAINLPNPRIIRKWYAHFGGNPGFNKESLKAIKDKESKTDNPLYWCLSLEVMSIRRNDEWNGTQCRGYVDFGDKLHNDCDLVSEAKEALVFLVACINSNFKVPVGYFLTNYLNGEQRTNLVLACLERLHDYNANVVALTFDGCPSNIKMASLLGCCLDPKNMKTYFNHPVSKEPVLILFDTCNMLQLVKMSLQVFQQFYNEQGQTVSWSYIQQLNDLQEKGNLHTSNKFRKTFKELKAQKVKLASEILSQGVAEVLDICGNEFKMYEFLDCGPTVEFITIFNNLFDILNSRSLNAYSYFKKPLNSENKSEVFTFLNKTEIYIKGLKDSQGQLLVQSNRKIGYLGFLVCIESTRQLYQYLIESNKIQTLPMYNFSKDHLDLFFCNVCSIYNNPTSRQFKAYYKQHIAKFELKQTEKGNCFDLDKISNFNWVSALSTINATSKRNALVETSKANIDDFEFSITVHLSFSDLSNQVLVYVSGYVVSFLLKEIKCELCMGALMNSIECENKRFTLIYFEDESGIYYPSGDVLKICKTAETLMRQVNYESQNIHLKTQRSKCKTIITNKVLSHFVGSDIFDSLLLHQFDQSATENHIVHLIRAVAECYFDVRIRYFIETMKHTLLKIRFLEQIHEPYAYDLCTFSW